MYYFRSRDKDGGHAIRSAVGANPMLHAHLTAGSVIDAEWCKWMEICNVRGSGFLLTRMHPLRDYLLWTFFQSCDLHLDPMTCIYELDPCCVEIHMRATRCWKVGGRVVTVTRQSWCPLGNIRTPLVTFSLQLHAPRRVGPMDESK